MVADMEISAMQADIREIEQQVDTLMKEYDKRIYYLQEKLEKLAADNDRLRGLVRDYQGEHESLMRLITVLENVTKPVNITLDGFDCGCNGCDCDD